MSSSFESPELTPEKTLEHMRAAFAAGGPTPDIPRPDNAMDLESYAAYRQGEQVGRDAASNAVAARCTGAWLQNRARALQVSRKRLAGLLWCWRECRAHADDERFVRAFEPLSNALAQFGVGTVPEDIAEQRELANTWAPAQREDWERVA